MKTDISKYTVRLNTNSITFAALNPSSQTIRVIVNDSIDTNCYDIETDMDWITIKGKLGEVTIVPLSNNMTNYTREGYIVFYHKADHEVFAVLDVTQNNISFEVNAKPSGITFPCEQEKTEEITVTVKGGRKRFYINAVNVYDKEGTRLTYDNAFEFTIVPSENFSVNEESTEYKLRILSRGIITLGARYEVVLTHSDLRTIFTTLNIGYEAISTEVPTIKHEDLILCETSPISYDRAKEINTASRQSKNVKSIQIEEKITESVDIKVNGIKNPDTINVNDNEVKVLVYTVIDNNGVKETDSDIYVKLSASLVSVRYAKNEYTKDYKVIYLKRLDNAKYRGTRLCAMTIYNRERRKQYRKTILKVKG